MKVNPSLFFPFILLIAVSCKKNEEASPVVVSTTVADTVLQTSLTPKAYDGYELIWNDEFNEEKIDTAKWVFETGTGVNGDFGTGQLDYATDRPENARIKKSTSDVGCLSITTREEIYNGRNYTSARLTTSGKGAWGPGSRIEARIWPKDILYKGQGFAFWMMPTQKTADSSSLTWPQGGEIDIMEFVGSVPFQNLASVHYAWSWENNQYLSWNHAHEGAYYTYSQQQVPNTDPAYGLWPATPNDADAGSGGFHLYRIDWYDNRLEFSIDEQVYHIHFFEDGAAFDNGVADGQDASGKTILNGKRIFKSEYSNHYAEWHPFEHKFFILLTAGVGGNDNLTYGGAIVPEAVFPSSTLVDWIRVYKRI